jgi:hypothetical protein
MLRATFFFFCLGMMGLLPALVGGVHMLPHGWVYRRENPTKFWYIFAAECGCLLMFSAVAGYAVR